jgi:hypothetical protein
MKTPNVHSDSRLLLTVNENHKRSHRQIKSRHTDKDEDKSLQKSMNMDLQPYIDDPDNPNPVLMEPVFEKKRKRIQSAHH